MPTSSVGLELSSVRPWLGLLLMLLLWPAPLKAETPKSPVSVGVMGDVTLVGLTGGVRPEVLVRPFTKAPGFNLRAAVGFNGGAEFGFVPFNVGLRGVVVPKKRVHPLFGTGVELQVMWMVDAPPVVRPALYFEAGVRVDLKDNLGIAFHAAPDIGFGPKPGFGMSLRLGVEFGLPASGGQTSTKSEG